MPSVLVFDNASCKFRCGPMIPAPVPVPVPGRVPTPKAEPIVVPHQPNRPQITPGWCLQKSHVPPMTGGEFGSNGGDDGNGIPGVMGGSTIGGDEGTDGVLPPPLLGGG